jgi:hypothetical protein
MAATGRPRRNRTIPQPSNAPWPSGSRDGAFPRPERDKKTVVFDGLGLGIPAPVTYMYH